MKTLPRLPRPSSVLGRLRLGEASLGYSGVCSRLVGNAGAKQVGRNIRDGEHIDGADAWKADALVTSDGNLLKKKAISGVRIITPAVALRLIEGTRTSG